MTRRLISTTTTSSEIPQANNKPEPATAKVLDATYHPSNYHTSYTTTATAPIVATAHGTMSHTHNFWPHTSAYNTAPAKANSDGMTSISIGGILTKVPTERVETPVQAPATMPVMPITQSLINQRKWNAEAAEEQNQTSGLEPALDSSTVKPVLATDAKVGTGGTIAEDGMMTVSVNGVLTRIPAAPITRSLIKQGLWREEEEVKESMVKPTTTMAMREQEEGCWSDEEDGMGFQTGYPVTSAAVVQKLMTKPAAGKGKKIFDVQGCYLDGEEASGDPANKGVDLGAWTPRQEVVRDEKGDDAACAAVSPDTVLGPSSETVPAEATMERYGRILHELPGDEKRKAKALMESIEELFPDSIRAERWYLSAIGALIGANLPHHIPDLYLYLLTKPQHRAPAARQALARRMREALVKTIPLHGMLVVSAAFSALAELEMQAPASDHDSAIWADKQITAERLRVARVMVLGMHGLGHGLRGQMWGSERDLSWINENISAALFLSDESTLSDAETELVLLPAAISAGGGKAAEVHMQSALRLGFEVEEVEMVHRICEVLEGWKSVGPRVGGVKEVKRVKDVGRN